MPDYTTLGRAEITVAQVIDIDSTYFFYQLVASTSPAPSKPSAADAAAFIISGTLPEGWSLSEPAYTEGSTDKLYMVILTKFTDSTGSWSEVTLSSSYEASKTAYNKSLVAIQSAANAERAAEDAQESANEARDSADDAKRSAVNASEYATRALGNLSTVQSVVETLTWITEHGTMTPASDPGYALTPDTTIVPRKTYYIRNGSVYTEVDLSDYNVTIVGTSKVGSAILGSINPHTEGWYEESINTVKVYFVLNDPPSGQTEPHGDYYVGGHYYDVVTDPKAEDMGNYYELSIDESLNNYVATHLAVTDEGLWVLPASINSYKVLIATGQGTQYTAAGIYMIDNIGDTVAYFDYHSLQMRDKEGNTYFHASDLRNTSGIADVREIQIIDEMNEYADYIPLTMPATSTDYSVKYNGSELTGCTKDINGVDLHFMADIGDIFEINYQTRSEKAKAYTLGTRNGSDPIGALSLVEGENGSASGYAAHSEGAQTIANGFYSHSQNYYTIASGYAQTAIGRGNIEDLNSKYALIIGNGTPVFRSNGLTVDWNGDVALNISEPDADSTALTAAITAIGWQNEVIV